MKIAGIDAIKTNEGKIVFKTEPPMTEAIFEELGNVWSYEGFDIDGDLLVWRGSHIEQGFREQAEIYLTEAENAVNANKTREKNQRIAFLKKITEQTGLPLV